MKDAPGLWLIEWEGTDDAGRPMRFGTQINACSVDHAEKRCEELNAQLVGRFEKPTQRRAPQGR